MNTIRITTTQNIELEYQLATLGDRILGRIIDGLVLLAYGLVVWIIAYNGDLFNHNQWILVLFFLPIVFYDLVSEVFMNGQSVGKRSMGIKVISLDGGQPLLSQYLIRWVFRVVDFSLTSGLCALICVAVSDRRQRVGDIVAGTTLIRTRADTSFSETLYTPTIQAGYIVTFPEVINLSDRDMQLVREVILNVSQTGNVMLANQAAEKIKDTLHIQSDMNPQQLLQLLLADYNHLTSQG